MAFNAKNLHYEKQEPAFLRRLKGANDAADGRHNVQVARPKKARLKTGDEGEDDPVILDESGNVLQKAVFEGMQKMEPTKTSEIITPNQPSDTVVSTEDNEISREVQQVADIGVSKKRKQAKAVGGGESDSDANPRESHATSMKANDKSRVVGKPDEKNKLPSSTTTKKVKNKTKKIKLSFDDPE